MGVSQSGIDLNEPTTQHYIRIMFATAQVVVILSYALIFFKIKMKSDVENKVTVEKKEPFGQNAGETKSEEMTHMQYDTSELKNMLYSLLVGFVITTWTHSKWGYIQPLLFQSIMQPLNLATHAIFRIHVLGQADQQGDLKRPWKDDKPGAMFEDMKKKLDPDAAEKEEKKEQKKLKGAANKAAVKSRR
eukprot:gene19482-23292_t